MKNSACVPQKISRWFFIGMILLAAFGAIVIGVTLLPVFGFILSVPLVALAIYLYRLRLNDQCELEA